MADEIVVAAAAPAAPAPAPVAPAPPPAPVAAAPAAPEPKVETPEPQSETPEPQAPLSDEAYVLNANVPDKFMDESRGDWLGSFSSLAPVVGIDAGTAQEMVDAFVDAATAMGEYTFDPTHGDYLDCTAEIVRQVGEEGAQNVIGRAQRYSASLGAGFQAWLDETNLGNEPSVIRVLALAETGLFKLSPEAAQKQLDTITRDPKGDYYSQDKQKRLPEVVRVQVLSRIANRSKLTLYGRDDFMTRPNPFAKPSNTGDRGSDSALRAEGAKLAAKLASKDGMSREDADRFMQITQKLAGGA